MSPVSSRGDGEAVGRTVSHLHRHRESRLVDASQIDRVLFFRLMSSDFSTLVFKRDKSIF